MSRRVYGLLALVWALVIFAASSLPGSAVGLASPWDKLAHALTYAVLAWLLRRSGLKPLAALVLTVAYGLSDEWHQSFVPGRCPDLADLLADATGGFLAIFCPELRNLRGQVLR
ncbi:VanZ family protein [Oceanithermus sp.]